VAAGMVSPLLNTYEQKAVQCEQPAHGAALYARLAEWQFRLNDNLSAAINAALRALDHEPSQVRSRALLEELLETEGRYGELVDSLDYTAEYAQSAEAEIEARHHKGAILRDQLDRRPEAIGEFEQIIDLSPDDLKALHCLAALYMNSGRLADTVAIWRQQYTLVEGDQQAYLGWQIGRVLLEELGDPEAAAPYLESACAGMGSFEAWSALAKSYQALRDQEGELVALEKCLSSPDRHGAIALLHYRIAELSAETGRDSDVVLDHWCDGLKAQPRPIDLGSALARSVPVPEGWRRITEILLAVRGGKRTQAVRQLCVIYRGPLAEDSEVETGWQTLLARSQDLGLVREEYAEWLRSCGRMSDLQAFYKNWASQDPVKAAMLLERAAELGDSESDNAGIAGPSVPDEPSGAPEPNVSARVSDLRAMFQNWRNSTNPAQKIELGRELLDGLSTKAGQRIEVLRWFARREDDDDKAQAYWTAILAERPMDREAQAGVIKGRRKASETEHAKGRSVPIGRMNRGPERGGGRSQPMGEVLFNRTVAALEKNNDWKGLAEIYRTRLGKALDEDDEYRTRMGLVDLLVERMDDTLGALEVIEPVRHRLRTVERARWLVDAYRQREDWDGYVKAMELMIPMAGDVDQCALWIERARIERQFLLNPEDALESLERALAVSPNHQEGLVTYVKVAEAVERWDSAVHGLARLARLENEPVERAGLLIRMGVLYWQRLQDHRLAAEAFEAGLGAHPDHLDGLKHAGRFFVDAENWRQAARILDRLLMKSSRFGKAEMAGIRQLRGRCAHEMDEPAEARQHLMNALESDPQNREALRLLRTIAFESKDWAEAFRYGQLYLNGHGALLSAENRAEEYYRLGVSKELLGEPGVARTFFEKALEEQPNHAAASRALEGEVPGEGQSLGDWMDSRGGEDVADSVRVVKTGDDDDE